MFIQFVSEQQLGKHEDFGINKRRRTHSIKKCRIIYSNHDFTYFSLFYNPCYSCKPHLHSKANIIIIIICCSRKNKRN